MDGVLIIDKPAGITSHDVVARVRRILRERRVGHTGTLDPFATGVLAILVGRATRLAQFLSGAEKEYEAVVRLGYATDTGDLTGVRRVEDGTEGTSERIDGTPAVPLAAATEACVRDFSAQEIELAMAPMRGEIDQVPPMYSAKKHQGRKLYELARRGEEIEREPVRVSIMAFVVQPGFVLLTGNPDGSRDLKVRVVCSAGTYVRALAEDFGKRLGVGAHLAALRRTRAGSFHLRQSVTLDQLEELSRGNACASVLVSPDAAMSAFPSLDLNAADVERVRHGVEVRLLDKIGADWPDGQNIRLRAKQDDLIAIGSFDKAGNLVRPRVVLGIEE
jgi:tRNA pseudouridine55 synthase